MILHFNSLIKNNPNIGNIFDNINTIENIKIRLLYVLYRFILDHCKEIMQFMEHNPNIWKLFWKKFINGIDNLINQPRIRQYEDFNKVLSNIKK